jgi:hypothetical protein
MISKGTERYTIVLSAEVASLTTGDNSRRTALLENHLKPYNYVKGFGVYKGTEEVSFKVKVCQKATVDDLVAVAIHTLGQECVLVIDNVTKSAELHFAHGVTERIGSNLYLTTEHEAKSADNYSIFHGQYWIVK